MDKQTLVLEIEAVEEKVGELLAEFEKRESEGEFEIKAITIRKSS